MRYFAKCILLLTLSAFFTSQHAHADKQSDIVRVKNTPMEPLLPCAPDDDLIVYTLKAADGFNIQVAIECRNGKLTAKWPIEPVKPETANEAP